MDDILLVVKWLVIVVIVTVVLACLWAFLSGFIKGARGVTDDEESKD